MSDLEKKFSIGAELGGVGLITLGGFQLLTGLMNISDMAIKKLAVLQAKLAQYPELTKKVVEEANKFADGMAMGDINYSTFFVSSIATGLCLGAGYSLLRRNK